MLWCFVVICYICYIPNHVTVKKLNSHCKPNISCQPFWRYYIRVQMVTCLGKRSWYRVRAGDRGWASYRSCNFRWRVRRCRSRIRDSRQSRCRNTPGHLGSITTVWPFTFFVLFIARYITGFPLLISSKTKEKDPIVVEQSDIEITTVEDAPMSAGVGTVLENALDTVHLFCVVHSTVYYWISLIDFFFYLVNGCCCVITNYED